MNQLCRHILPAGRHCTQPAVRTTLYCRHHQVIKRALAQVEPKPDPYGIYKPLPFVFPEDRAALQINFMLVAQALNDRSIHIQMANAFNRIFRSCEINLSRGPLTEPSTKARTKKSAQDQDQDWDHDGDQAQDYNPACDPNIVQRIILTPEGEEIAEHREVLEKNEAPPTHGKECPCSFCDEEYRGAPLEEHHPNCKCGLCEEPTKPQPAASEQQTSSGPPSPIIQAPVSNVILSEAEGSGTELSSRPEQSEVEGPAVPQPSHKPEVEELSSRPERSEVEGPGTELSSRPERSEVEGPAIDLSSRPERSEVEGPAVPQPSHELTAGKNLDHCDGPSVLSVSSVVKHAFPQPSHQAEVKELSSQPKQNEAERSAIDLSSQPKQNKAERPAVELSSLPKQSEVEGPAVPQPSHEIKAGKNLDHCDRPPCAL